MARAGKIFCCAVGFVLCFCLLTCRDLSAQISLPDEKTAAEAGIDNDSCFVCHADQAEAHFVDAGRFAHSSHGKHLCVSCHTDIQESPHDTPLKPVNCRSCHAIESEVYLESDHGIATSQGISQAASCQNCHGEAHYLLNPRDKDSSVFRANIPQTCGQCHSNAAKMKNSLLKQQDPVLAYHENVHGLALKGGNLAAAVCTDCHGSHDLHRATNPQSKLFWQNIPKTCGKCHENVLNTYMRSIHAQAMIKGERDAPVCTDCHGEHAIEAVKQAGSKVFSLRVPETCGQCHGIERINTKYSLPKYVMETYMDSFHGLSSQMGSVTAANCASCHGFHDILPHTDARSSTHPDNLPKTCGQCHAGVGSLVTDGKIHAGATSGVGNEVVQWVRRFYMILIFAVLGFMFLHNGLDYYLKLRIHYERAAHAGKVIRLNFSERVQHGLLAISFTILAYTGFAIKYPLSWWAAPFVGHGDWRSLGHRVGALIFCVLTVYHVFYITCVPRGRRHIKELFLRRSDWTHIKGMFQYYLGLRQHKPPLTFYSYIEKIEYWALVWGSMVMIVTGALMLDANKFLGVFPKWFYDVLTAVHFYEAVLATAAILLWHGYFVMFDPDEYPMKWTWLSGKESEVDRRHRNSGHHQ